MFSRKQDSRSQIVVLLLELSLLVFGEIVLSSSWVHDASVSCRWLFASVESWSVLPICGTLHEILSDAGCRIFSTWFGIPREVKESSKN